jgi:lysophospholipase L1-like esterase
MSLSRMKWTSWLCLIIVAFLMSVCLMSLITIPKVHAASQSISPTDPNIKYVGRWDTSSSTVYKSYWPGAYFETRFTGTTVAIKLASAANIYTTIDGGTDILHANANGTMNLTSTPLASGTHLLRVAARTDSDYIAFQGLVLDAGATTIAPTLSSKLIEFVGDSITAGYSDSKYALSDYAWLIGEQLGVQHTQIAQSGICLVDNIQCYSANAIGMSRQFFKLQNPAFPNSPNWDFSRYQASAVVINLGTNDSGFSSANAAFQSTYTTFLRNIRNVYPAARIFVLRTFLGAEAAPTQAAVQAVGDSNIQYVDTTGWLSSSDYSSDGIHPNDGGQAKVANRLGPIISAYLGTVATPTPIPTPTSTPGSTPTATPTGTVGASCSIHYTVTNQWQGGFGASLTITNTSSTAINGWSLKFSFPNGQTITQPWNGTVTQSGSAVTMSNVSYNGAIPAGGTLSSSPGFNGTWTGSNGSPTAFTLNGAACSIV